MIDYLYNPDFWELEWTWQSINRKILVLPLLMALATGHFRNKVHLKIICFACFSLVMEHLSRDADTKNIFHADTNSPWYHILTPLLFLLLTRFFSDYLDKGKYSSSAWVLPMGFTILIIINATLGSGFYVFPSMIIGLYSLLGIMLSLGYFFYLLRFPKENYIERVPMFWVSSGLLIYFSGNLLVWFGFNFYDRELYKSIYRVNYMLTVLLYSFFTIAICLNPQSENKTPTT